MEDCKQSMILLFQNLSLLSSCQHYSIRSAFFISAFLPSVTTIKLCKKKFSEKSDRNLKLRTLFPVTFCQFRKLGLFTKNFISRFLWRNFFPCDFLTPFNPPTLWHHSDNADKVFFYFLNYLLFQFKKPCFHQTLTIFSLRNHVFTRL